MTKKPRKRLSRLHIPFLLTLLALLIGLFVYALVEHQTFFMFLAVGLFINIIILYIFHLRLMHKKSHMAVLKEDYFEKANLMKADLRQEQDRTDALREKIIRYSELKWLVENLTEAESLQESIDVLACETARLMDQPQATALLYLVDHESRQLTVSSAYRARKRIFIKSKLGDIFDQWVLKRQQPLLIEDTKSDFRFDLSKISLEGKRGINSVMSVPLISHNQVLGVLRVDSPQVKAFDSQDWRFLRTIAELGTIAIENAQLFERIEELAIRDGLTGLFLRRHLNERLDNEIEFALKKNTPLSFMMVDLDFFKKYNDKYGHTAGDLVLKTVSDALTGMFNAPGQLICRYGGEEFAIMLPNCSKDQAVQLAENLRKKIEGLTVILRRKETNITVSIGVATLPDDAGSKEVLIHKADHALYKAKGDGRNKVCVG